MLEIQSVADERGMAHSDFVGFHTKRAGLYSVRAYVLGMPWQSGPVTEFQVFPDTVSPSLSRVESLRDAAPADGTTEAKVRVRLSDKNGNPISSHFVELISSRSHDTVRMLNGGATDRYGEAYFYVTSRKDGVSYFTAFDRNNGITLDPRAQAVFFQSASGGGAMGGNLRMYMASGLFDDDDPDPDDETYGDTAGFEIVMPAKVEVGKSVDVKVVAIDAFGITVKDHTGTIIFTTNDDDATIPDNYRFNDRDQGAHTFEDGIIFSRTGNFKITVIDFIPDLNRENENIKAELTVEVVDRLDPTPTPMPEPTEAPTPTPGVQGTAPPIPSFSPLPGFPVNEPVIKSPTNNSEHGGSGNIALMGNGAPNTDLKVFLDTKEWLTTTVDSYGNFNGQLIDMADGQHTVYVQMTDQPDVKSAPVSFVVDTTPPLLDPTAGVEINPPGQLEPGQALTIKIVSESKLASVKVNIGNTGSVAELIERSDQPGTYQLTFDAPQATGNHSLTLILEDRFVNRTEITNAGIISVKGKAPLLTAPAIVEAFPGDTQVRLIWQPVIGTDIAGYKIYSGVNNLLIDKLESQVLAPKTEVMINNLENGRQYFFQISAVGVIGTEGPRSNATAVIPLSPDTPQPSTPFPTPIQPTPDTPKRITGLPADGMIELNWEAPAIQSAAFDIRFGISAGTYTERFSVSGNVNSTVIPDLINGLPYYITLVPLTVTGVPTGERYIELRASPSFSGMHKAAEHPPISNLSGVKRTSDNGPEAIFLLFLSLSFGGSMFFFHRAYRFARVE